MEVQILHDKQIILAFLKKNEEIQIYCIGDLDEFFWPKTIWYGLTDGNEIFSIALLYAGMQTPTLLLFCDNDPAYSLKLLDGIRTFLPGRFFAHLSPGLIKAFGRKNIIEDYGMHYKMALRKLYETDDKKIRRLSPGDLPSILNFYSIAYPQNWFDRRMLETGKYFGYFIDNELAGISGIHVYSKSYRVSALGNIATHPAYRGQQIAFKLTSKLCSDLIKDVNSIGLNVKSDNEPAIKCYRKTGFEIVGKYEEFLINNH